VVRHPRPALVRQGPVKGCAWPACGRVHPCHNLDYIGRTPFAILPSRMAWHAGHECKCEARDSVVVDAQQSIKPSSAFKHLGRMHLGTGDSSFVPCVLPPGDAAGMLDRIRDEVEWCVMRHKGGEVPRLVSVQATLDADGEIESVRPIHAHTHSIMHTRCSVASVENAFASLACAALVHSEIIYTQSC
jgi:hypothetical protein